MPPVPDQPDLYAALRDSRTAPEQLEAMLALSEAPVRTRLESVDRGLLRAVLRAGCGMAPVPAAPAIRDWIAGAGVAPMLVPAPGDADTIVLRTDGRGDPAMPAYSDRAFDAWFAATGARYGIGPYGEHRSVYATAQFADNASPERRTVHLGIDIFAPAGTALHAPLPGIVRHLAYNADPLDYGHTLILEHDAGGVPFWTLYGHLAGTLPGLLSPGAAVAAGQHIADLGDWHENGGWAAHVHFQIMTDMLDQSGGNFFGVGHASLWDVWQAICPDPDLILRLPPGLRAR